MNNIIKFDPTAKRSPKDGYTSLSKATVRAFGIYKDKTPEQLDEIAYQALAGLMGLPDEMVTTILGLGESLVMGVNNTEEPSEADCECPDEPAQGWEF